MREKGREREREREKERKRDGKKRRVRLVTLCRANFGTVLENFSLAAYRGKLGEISTWPIVLHYSGDEVHLPLVRWEEICICGWEVAKLTFAQMSYMTPRVPSRCRTHKRPLISHSTFCTYPHFLFLYNKLSLPSCIEILIRSMI